MLIDAVKNKITAGEVKHDITESMLELATDVCRDINPVIVNESNGRYYEPAPGRNYGIGVNVAWRFE